MDLRGQLAVVRAHGLLIIGSVAIAMLAALVASYAMPKVYQSQATLIVGQSLTTTNPDIGQLDTSQRLGETYARIATTRPVLEAVIAKLGLDTTANALLEQVSAAVVPNSTLLTVTVSQGDPETAAKIANEIGAQLIEASPTVRGEQADVQDFVLRELRTLQGQIEAAQAEVQALNAVDPRTKAQDQRLATVSAELTSLRSAYAELHSQSVTSAANRLSVVEPAVAELTPTSPKVVFNVVLALLAGLLIGVGAAFVIENLSDSVTTPEDAEQSTGLPTLGTVPRMRELPGGNPIYSLATLVYPRSSVAESFRVLRTNLEFSGVDAPIHTIVVTSALPREGKTTIASNLAVAFAQAGRTTILVDADLRRPGVHAVFGIAQGPGLTDLLRSDSVNLGTVMRPTQDPNLRVIPSGELPPNPAELVGSARMQAVLSRIAEGIDVVILDTPPINVVTDAALLAKAADGTILVIDSGKTRRDAARAAREALGRVGVRVLGVTLNRGRRGFDRSYDYYEQDTANGSDGPDSAGLPVRPAGSQSTTR